MKKREETGFSESTKQVLWVISELYYPEDTSTGYYLTRIAEGLAETFDVKVLCGQPNYLKRGIRAPWRERYRSVDIFRAWSTTLDKNVIPYRLLNMATLGLSIFFLALRNFRKGDQVLVVTTPPLLPFIAAFAALFRGASYTLLIHDLYPELLIAVGKASERSLLVSIAKFANRWLYKYASRMIAVGRDMRQLLETRAAGLDVPIKVIPNWAELETVSPSPREENPLLGELGIMDKFVLLFAGNIGLPNDVESIVEAAEILSGEPVCFVFLGNGAKKAWLEREASRRKLSNIMLLPPRPRSEQNIFLNACDVGLVSLISGMKGVSMPSRTYNILAAGKPIIAITEEGSELDLVVKEDRVGVSVTPGNPEKLSRAIIELSKSGSELLEMGKRARKAAEARYSVESALAAYSEAFGESKHSTGVEQR